MSKALILTAGGLDSILVIKLVQTIKIEYQVVHFDIGLTYDKPILAGQRISKYFGLEDLIKNGIEIDKFDIAKEFYAYILNRNNFIDSPVCLEYKIFLLKKAKEYMQQIGAEFIITGDVLEQRSLVQGDKALAQADSNAGTEGIVFRPLSALLLNNDSLYQKLPVLKEISFDFIGFTQKRFELADKLGIVHDKKDHSYLPVEKTELNMGRKAFQIFEKQQNYDLSHLNRVGQHFKLNEEGRFVMGRTPFESNYLKHFYDNFDKKIVAFSSKSDRFYFGFIYKSKDIIQEEELALQIFSSVVSGNTNLTSIAIYDNLNQLLGSKNVDSKNIDINKFILHTNDVFCPVIPLNINYTQ